MKEYLKFNLNSYYNKDANKFKVIWLLPLCLIIILIIFWSNYDAYNIYETNAIYYCEKNCTLNFYHSANEPLTYDYLKINDKICEIADIFYGEIELDANNNEFQKITLSIKGYEGRNNEVVKLKIYKNKEKILKKIYQIIKER